MYHYELCAEGDYCFRRNNLARIYCMSRVNKPFRCRVEAVTKLLSTTFDRFANAYFLAMPFFNSIVELCIFKF